MAVGFVAIEIAHWRPGERNELARPEPVWSDVERKGSQKALSVHEASGEIGHLSQPRAHVRRTFPVQEQKSHGHSNDALTGDCKAYDDRKSPVGYREKVE